MSIGKRVNNLASDSCYTKWTGLHSGLSRKIKYQRTDDISSMKTRVLAHRVWASRKLSVPDFPIPWFLRASRFSKWRHHFQNVKEKGNFLLGKPPNVKERKTSLREFPKSWKSENLKFSIFENPENFKNVKEKGNLLLRKSPNSEILKSWNSKLSPSLSFRISKISKSPNPEILKLWNPKLSPSLLSPDIPICRVFEKFKVSLKIQSVGGFGEDRSFKNSKWSGWSKREDFNFIKNCSGYRLNKIFYILKLWTSQHLKNLKTF